MMFRLEAPWPSAASTILLPSPELSNTLANAGIVDTRRMMDGSMRTFIKRKSNRKIHKWDFICTQAKTYELTDFIKRYPSATYRAVWDEVIIGKITLNPIEPAGQGTNHYNISIVMETI
jgi:hypothetical protein